MPNKLIRRVKLHSKYHPRPKKGWTVTAGKNVPWLTLSGLWLEQAGFKIGDTLEITVSNNQLIIQNMADSR